MLSQNFAVAGVVVDDQSTQADELGARQASVGRRGLGHRIEAYFEPKCGAVIYLAVHADLAAHQRGQLPANGQSQAGAPVLAGGERVCLAEGVEYMRLCFRGNADAGVDYLEAQQSVLADRPDPDDDLSRVPGRT